jgi:hypothetical protein
MNAVETMPELSTDIILGIDRALGFHERAIEEAIAAGADREALADYTMCLNAAKTWLMRVMKEYRQ